MLSSRRLKTNAQITTEILTQVLAGGSRNFVVCAGARNAPIVVPLLKLNSRGGIRIWHHFDERAAAFFALGLAKRRLEPVCVVTTSGTAVAELLPATIEAHYSGVPLILLTADRPERFRGSGAPQAIEQVNIFGPYAGTEVEEWGRESPLHLNVCLEEPLFDGEVELEIPGVADPRDCSAASLDEILTEAPDLVIVGELLESERLTVAGYLQSAGCPVWCEAISGLREVGGIEHIRGGDSAIAQLSNISRVVRLGGVPSLRFWRDLETRPEIAVTSVSRTGFSGLAREDVETIRLRGGIGAGGASPVLEREQGEQDDSTGYDPEERAIHDLSKRIPSDALIFLGNSLPIREWNLAATVETAHPHCFANRGANGIDGEISTFLGMCQDFGGDECWGIFGDLTTLYDMSAPWIVDQLDTGKRIHIVVIDNGGGKIFSKLPGLKDLPDGEKRITENWHAFDFNKWAGLWSGVETEVIDLTPGSGSAEE